MREELCTLLVQLFDDAELKRFITFHYPDLEAKVFAQQARYGVAFEFLQALARRGQLGPELRRQLIRARPDRKAEIEAAWGGREPKYETEREQELGEMLEALYEQRATLAAQGSDLTAVTSNILAIKREQRSGPKLVAGDRLGGRYKLLRILGSGGFATVWAAYDPTARREVAVKVLHGQYASGGERVERFYRGARLMQQIDHSNVVRVLEPHGDDDGYRYFVMELLPGGDLWQLIKKRGLAPDRLLDHIEGVAEVLAAAHARRMPIIHRDVKPANILLTANGQAKLTDFDLVRAGDTTGGTRTGALGTFVYAAPEALQNAGQAGPTADVYGLAMTAVAGLLGREANYAEKSNPGPLVDGLPVSVAVREVLKSALWIDPARRPRDAAVFLERFRAAREGRSGPSKPAAGRPLMDRRLWLPGGVAVGLGLALGWIGGQRTVSTEDVATGEPAVEAQQGAAKPPSVPSGMVKVPGGEFLMGCNEDVDSQCDPDEKPSRTDNVPTFYIDKTEVTVAAYGKCVEAEQCKRETFWTKDNSKYCNRGYDKRDRHPMNCVSWHGAAAYCKFVGKRLPSEAEWEKAARGTDGRKYPWGNKPSASCSRAVIDDGKTKDTAGSETDGCGRDSTWPVGSKSAGNSPFGVSDMVGNVWEWTADWYEHSSIKRGKYRSVRGGSWLGNPKYARASERFRCVPSDQYNDVGFRCAQSD